jgi:valyl-tRNA synthetase/predicted acetyltransferase/protein-tyrosine-phosphatase
MLDSGSEHGTTDKNTREAEVKLGKNPKILFVCKGNMGRSQMAKGLYNYYTKSDRADSAGTFNDAEITTEELAEEIREETGNTVTGIDVLAQELGVDKKSLNLSKRMRITPEMLKKYDLLVNLAEKSQTPDWLRGDNVVWWDVKDPTRYATEDDLKRAYREIDVKIKQLLNGEIVDDNLWNEDLPPLDVWEANKDIAKGLKKAGVVWKIEYIEHEYPFYPRSGGRIMYRAVPSWFMDINGQKKEMLAENENVNWFPAHIKEGRFRKNIEQAPDWNLSRNRFWATALPVWKGDKGTIKVVGSYDELYELSGVRLDDYHRPWVDEVEFDIDGEHFHRVEEVVDGWFESGSMPFAQFHYPFENREKFEKNFPGDFITEYIGQTRAWFYYVHAVGVALSSVGAFGGVSIRQFSMSDGEREMEFLRELAKDGDWHSPANPEDLKNLKSFKKWLKIIDDEAHGRNLREGRAPAKMYWIEKNGEIVGTGSVRLKLSTPILAELGGHIGWGLLKKYRGQGIMTKASGLLIAEARKSGLGDLMITATEDNVASRKIIEKNGGILDKIAETPFRKGVKSAFYTIPKNVQPEICAATNAFKNVIVTGTLAGNDGLKMSKSRGNYTDPMELLDQYSADAYRLTLLGSPVCAGEDFALTDKDVSDTNRKLAMIWNVYDFFTMYASVDGWEFQPEKPLLALDIDDVLAATIPGAFEYFSKKLGRPAPSLYDYTEDWAKLMGVDEKTAADLMKEIYADDEFFGSVDEVAGAKKALEKLHNKFKIVAVTSRPPSMEKITRAWIQKNFAGLFDEVYMMNFFDEISADAAKKTKGEFVKKLGARWLIDDQPKHCNSAIENGVKAICFGDYPWSKTGLNDGILRADDWEKVEEILQSDVVNPLPKLQPDDVENPLDKWIISRAHQLLDEVSVGIEKYDLPEAVSPILPFVDDLSNWYVRRSRRRFWKNENDDDKNFAYATLHYTLLLLSQIIAPFCPFIAEELYHNLTGDEGGSVHLLDWPDGGEKDEQVLADMARTRKLIELGLALRMDKNSEGGQIKIRQPLSRATYAGAKLSDDYEQIIAEELNVKTVTYVADIKKYVSANYFDDAKILEQVRDANADVSGWLEISKRLTPELKAEGLAREIIRAVQNARKAAGLNVDDRIELTLKTGDETLRNAIETWRDTIMKETLALKLTPDQPRQYEIEKSIDGALVAIGLSKIEN